MTTGRNILENASRRPLLWLYLICFVAWLPGFFTLPPLDRDESRFAQASKQMIETGDYVDIRFSDGPRYKKPAGIHWLQALSTMAFGNEERNQIWTYRLPSLLGAFAAVGLAFWAARAFAGREAAFLGALLLGLTLLLSAESKISKTDAVLIATVLASQGVLMRAYLSARDAARAAPTLGLALAGWTAFAIGVLLKGPIILAVCAVTIVAISLWDRDWKWFARVRPGPGVLLMLAIVLPWGIAIAIESQGLFYEKSLGEDFAKKLVSGQETHGAPPGYYLALVSFSLWPATLIFLPGIASAIPRRSDPALRYLLAWAGACWLMFEAVPTKLPHYILPAYPPLVFLGALWLMRARDAVEARWERIARHVSLALFLIVGLAFAAFIAIAPEYWGSGSPWFLYVGGAIAAIAAVAAGLAMVRGDRVMAGLLAAATALVLYPFAGEGTAPRVERIWISPRAADAVAHYRLPGDPPAILAGYVEPSLVFLLGTDTRLTTGDKAADLALETGGLALIEKRHEVMFMERLFALRASAEPLEVIDGFNYSRGRDATLTLYRVRPAATRSQEP